MTAKEVINEILGFYNLSASELARELNMEPSRINQIVIGRTRTISKALYDALLNRFPTLNPGFIVGDGGNMHIDGKQKQPSMSVSERIDLILQQYQLTPTAFSKQLGWNVQVVTQLRNGTYRSITKERITDITKVFKELNPRWLNTGTGKMFIGARIIDTTLPMPKPIRSFSSDEQKVQKPEKPKKVKVSKFDQAAVNKLLVEQITMSRKELERVSEELTNLKNLVTELQNERSSSMVAEGINHDKV